MASPPKKSCAGKNLRQSICFAAGAGGWLVGGGQDAKDAKDGNNSGMCCSWSPGCYHGGLFEKLASECHTLHLAIVG